MVYLPLLTYICHENQLNVGKYTVHGCFGVYHRLTQLAGTPLPGPVALEAALRRVLTGRSQSVALLGTDPRVTRRLRY